MADGGNGNGMIWFSCLPCGWRPGVYQERVVKVHWANCEVAREAKKAAWEAAEAAHNALQEAANGGSKKTTKKRVEGQRVGRADPNAISWHSCRSSIMDWLTQV